MRKIILSIILIFASVFYIQSVFADENTQDMKQKAIALYATKNYKEAFKMLDSLPSSEKDSEVFVLLSNIALEQNKDSLAIQNLNKALDKDYKFYKAYYNLGCIFAKKKSYLLATNNFELAIKYNKTFAPAYYNLANCQMQLRDYESAKKNLIKAVEFEPTNKDYLYNLAYCYKALNQEKKAKKIIDAYNKLG